MIQSDLILFILGSLL